MLTHNYVSFHLDLTLRAKTSLLSDPAAADCHSRTAWTYSSVSAPDRYEVTTSGLTGGSFIVARLRAAQTLGGETRYADEADEHSKSMQTRKTAANRAIPVMDQGCLGTSRR